jgi:hypothetical protein
MRLQPTIGDRAMHGRTIFASVCRLVGFMRNRLYLDLQWRGPSMNTTIGIAMICVAVAMIWVARPADGVSIPFSRKHGSSVSFT